MKVRENCGRETRTEKKVSAAWRREVVRASDDRGALESRAGSRGAPQSRQDVPRGRESCGHTDGGNREAFPLPIRQGGSERGGLHAAGAVVCVLLGRTRLSWYLNSRIFSVTRRSHFWKSVLHRLGRPPARTSVQHHTEWPNQMRPMGQQGCVCQRGVTRAGVSSSPVTHMHQLCEGAPVQAGPDMQGAPWHSVCLWAEESQG